MAIVKNDPFPGTDYSGYQKWEKVTTPGGQTWYVVPGFPGYVYDPVASNASGRKVFRANPRAQIADQQQKEDAAKKLQDQQMRNASPMGQLLPVATTAGGTLIANEIMNSGFGKAPPVAINIDPKTGNVLFNDGTIKNAAGEIIKPTASAPVITPDAVPVAATTQGQAAAQGMISQPGVAPTPVGTTATGGTLMSDGSVQTNSLPAGAEVAQDGSIVDSGTGATIGRVAQGVGGAYQIYQGVQDFKRDKVGGGLGVASGISNVGAALGSGTLGSAAGPLAIAKGGYDVVGAFNRNGEGLRAGTTELGAGIGTMLMPGIGTGIGAVAGNVLGYGLQGNGWKNDAALVALGPAGWGVLGAKKLGLVDKLMHKTTRQSSIENTQNLLTEGKGDKAYQAYVQAMREQYNSAPVDPSKPFAGKYKTWEEYQKGGLEAADLTGVYGNIKTYGPEWASLTQEQRQAVTQSNIDSGLYNSKKGEVEITDAAKAKENYDKVMKGFEAGAVAATKPGVAPLQPGQTAASTANIATGAATPAQAATTGLMRSSTRSPGIGLNGQRIVY